jgi:LysM repeat protein
MDIGGWLRSIGLGKYEATFRDNAIDEQVFRHLTTKDLKEIGVAVAAARRRTFWRKCLSVARNLSSTTYALTAAACTVCLALLLLGYLILVVPGYLRDLRVSLATADKAFVVASASDPERTSPRSNNKEVTTSVHSLLSDPTLDNLAAIAPPAPASATPTDSRPVAVKPAPSSKPASATLPQFDVVRVGPDGNAVIAGRAEPNAAVTLLDRGLEIDHTPADGAGQFAILPKHLDPGDHVLSLRMTTKERSSDSAQNVAVRIPSTPKGEVLVARAEAPFSHPGLPHSAQNLVEGNHNPAPTPDSLATKAAAGSPASARRSKPPISPPQSSAPIERAQASATGGKPPVSQLATSARIEHPEASAKAGANEPLPSAGITQDARPPSSIGRVAPSPTATHTTVEHKVAAGDTLMKIARKYGVSPRVLARANHLQLQTRLEIGMLLTISVDTVGTIKPIEIERDARVSRARQCGARCR